MINGLPNGWICVELDQLLQPRNLRVFPRDVPDAPYVGLEQVEAHTNRLVATIPAATMSSSAMQFSAGDVLYGRMRPYLNKVVRPQFEGVASAEFIVFPTVRGIDNDFLCIRLSASDFVAFACSQYEGDRPRVKFDQLGKFKLALPPESEQIRIVEKVEELLSDLDAGVAELESAQKKLDRYRQSLLKAAVQGALTAEWRERNPPEETGAQLLERIIAERCVRWEQRQLFRFAEQGKRPPKYWRDKYTEPSAPEVGDLPTLPEGWIWASADQLTPEDLSNGRSVPSASEGARVLRLTSVRNGRIDLNESKHGSWSEAESRPYWVSEGDLLIVRGNGSLSLVGRAGLVPQAEEPVAFPDTLIRLRVLDAVVAPGWVALAWDTALVRSHLERRARTSAGIYKISQPDILSAVLPVPPLAEQLAVLSLMDGIGSELASIESAIERLLAEAAAQRQNILRAAFAGELVPQDPDDEPASALLARIRAERAADAVEKKPRQAKARKARKAADA